MLIGKYDFECTWEQDSILPAFPGSMLRGALGHALKKTICTIKNTNCETCLLNSQCLYSRVFENKKTKDNTINVSSVPHPYMIEWKNDISKKYCTGDSFVFSLILFGQFVEMLPYFVYAVIKMGEDGLGKRDQKGSRNRMKVKTVAHQGKSIYTEGIPKLPPEIPSVSLDDFLRSNDESSSNSIVKVNLETPFRLKKNGKFVRDLDFETLIQAITRRIDAVWKTYGSMPLKIDRDTVMSTARSVKTIDKNVNWIKQLRYSNRQSTSMNMDGIGGEITFSGNIGPLMGYLKIAELLHVGKSTSFGLGKLSIETLS